MRKGGGADIGEKGCSCSKNEMNAFEKHFSHFFSTAFFFMMLID